MPPSYCAVCKLALANYKCPLCGIPFCSVPCSKKHKELEGVASCKKNIKPVRQQETNQIAPIQTFLCPTEDTVALERLRKLETNSELKQIMKNPHLRDILFMVDRTKNPAATMQKVMLEPIFVEFAEQCLKTVEEDN